MDKSNGGFRNHTKTTRVKKSNWIQAATSVIHGAVKPASSCHTSGRTVGINRAIRPSMCSWKCLGKISSLSKAPRFNINHECWRQNGNSLQFQFSIKVIYLRLVDNCVQNLINLSLGMYWSLSMRCHWTIYVLKIIHLRHITSKWQELSQSSKLKSDWLYEISGNVNFLKLYTGFCQSSKKVATMKTSEEKESRVCLLN